MEQTSSMRIKSYFADSVEHAIQQARQELGAEAMLITSRRSAPEARSLGAYEVVFGLHAASIGERKRISRPAAALPNEVSRDLSGELQNLRVQLQEIKKTLQGSRGAETGLTDCEELFEELVSNDLARPVAQDIVSTAARLRDQLSRDPTAPATALRAYAAEVVSNKLEFAPPFQKASGEKASPEAPRVVAFTGPPGAGKTTTLIKIAIRECLTGRHPVRILSVDPYRVAAHERLRSLATLVGVGFSAINSTPEFLAALEESRSKSVVLVDTPGYSLSEMDGAEEIAAALTRVPNKQIHLVLPASMKREDLMRAVRAYAAFKPDYLLFTKLDETASLGAVLSTALEAAKPLSFFASGQNIPEDIEPAHARGLLASVFEPEIAEAVPAA
jgi:flagellar biosynthesis protein FlhF